jgi:rhamnogalacturonan endolyase
VTGRLVLNDPEKQQFPGRVLVGLAQPTYKVIMPGGREAEITWQTDAKHYQFWVQSDSRDGSFTIPKVSPGKYMLYALADGVLGEFARVDVAVDAGEVVDLGELEWTPVRHGKQVWEIGIPNRTATEFAGGDRFFEPDIVLQYARLFPDDVAFTIGESRYDKDWFFAHVPHNTDPEARVQPFRGVSGNGRATLYTIRFHLDEAPQGSAVLRLAISGTGTRSIEVSVNGKQAGTVNLSFGDGVIARHQIQGLWYERELEFDASMLRAGSNTMALTVPAGNLTAGVIYDYLRLEMDDSQ